jgi:hypothetical protein
MAAISFGSTNHKVDSYCLFSLSPIATCGISSVSPSVNRSDFVKETLIFVSEWKQKIKKHFSNTFVVQMNNLSSNIFPSPWFLRGGATVCRAFQLFLAFMFLSLNVQCILA